MEFFCGMVESHYLKVEHSLLLKITQLIVIGVNDKKISQIEAKGFFLYSKGISKQGAKNFVVCKYAKVKVSKGGKLITLLDYPAHNSWGKLLGDILNLG
ncbi:hypothetical protein M0802_013038 [Mischocyttarus mexicanus]|nr:hypothetical protein M0802_013038 [Mischocyttarus mexicanus]